MSKFQPGDIARFGNTGNTGGLVFILDRIPDEAYPDDYRVMMGDGRGRLIVFCLYAYQLSRLDEL